MSAVRTEQRFRRDRFCPVCGGYPEAPHGRGVRCWGFLSDDGAYAYCTREERAGSLSLSSASAYAHRLVGDCYCGVRHGANGDGVVRKLVWRFPLASGSVAEHHREDRADGSKRMWWQRDGKRRLGGLRVEDLPLYGSDELRHLPKGSRVVVVEGENARDALQRRGIVAVATVTGAKGLPSEESLRVLLDYVVILWPDADADGRAHMRRIAERLRELGHENVRILDWLDAPHAGDAADFFACGGTPEHLEALATDAAIWTDTADMAALDIHSAALRDAVPAERMRLAFVTARELASRTPQEPSWVVKDYIARGAVTELVAKVKAGKTTLALGMCAAAVRGELFAGLPTAPTRCVVYLTEQGDASFREAIRRARLLDSEALAVLSYHRTIGVKWPEVVGVAVTECERRRAEVLVVDTLPQWAGLRGDAENAAGDALEAIRPLQQAASVHGLAVLALRHSRKSGGEIGDDGRGSSAFAGAVDVLLSLRRREGNAEPSVRILHALSRFEQTPETLALRLTDKGYVALGSEAALGLAIAKREILEAAPRIEELALTVDELIAKAAVRRTTGQEAIAVLADVRALLRTGEGKKGSPFRYYAPGASEMLSAGTTHIGRQKEIGHADARTLSVSEGRSLPGTGMVSAEDEDPMFNAVLRLARDDARWIEAS